MDDSFAFRTTVPLRRQFDPRTVRATVLGVIVVLGTGLFTHWVIASERASFSRVVRREVPTQATADPVDVLTSVSTDADAEQAIGVALAAAQVAFSEHRSFLDATPARLSALQRGYIFVDGPSTMPEIVSVAARADTWAAAVKGLGGTCFWVRATMLGEVTHGIGSVCSGSAALSPPPPR